MLVVCVCVCARAVDICIFMNIQSLVCLKVRENHCLYEFDEEHLNAARPQGLDGGQVTRSRQAILGFPWLWLQCRRCLCLEEMDSGNARI